ncbi:MAG: hypothetical protein H0U95_18270 [Bacteroidetes bacterium]|nr:hypothetical protein [Bacteroidota bacterium]
MHLKEVSHINYRRLLFSVNDSFVSSNTSLNADINYFIQCPNNINASLTEFYTLLVNLALTEEDIRKNIYHRTFSEINSFLNNQQFEYKIELGPSKNDLNQYIKMFDRFAGYKKIRKAEAFRLKAYNTNGILAVSYIKQNGKFLCLNFYRATKQRATNLYSFHLKHELNNDFNNSHIGRAHRALHWLDILEFKKAGASYYDFCGWYNGSEDKELLNINKFKEQFTQNKVKEYSGVIYKNKLLAFLKKIR